jgi:Xaa-Pro aminopeptidase
MANTPAHVRQLQQSLSPGQAILLSAPTDLTYFADFYILLPEEREGFFVVTVDDCYLIKATFSPAAATPRYHILEQCKPLALAQHLATIIRTHQLHELALDYSSLYVDEHQAIQSVADKDQVSLVQLDKNRVWQCRMIKDEQELEKMRVAGKYGQFVFTMILEGLHQGITEKEVAKHIEVELLKLGADKSAFPSIVAFGAGGAAPHYQPGNVPLTNNTAVLIDMGAMVDGYRSDLTRSFWFGDQPDAEFIKVEQIVTGAYQKTLDFLENEVKNSRPVAAKDLDHAARDLISQQGYEKEFIHTTGHGVGLDIHEPPSLNWNNSQTLETGMIITIEPGVYLPGKFGFRYENTILLKEKTIEVLTQ